MAGRRTATKLAGLLAILLAWAGPVAAANLTAADVARIIAQAASEAAARGTPATIAVVDRVGNVLAIYQMTGAGTGLTISSGRGIPAGNGLEQAQALAPLTAALASVGARLSAVAKAITGAYLSSGGNAFTTRTASQIVQEHFNPGETMASSGPLFGVQFTQLPCSDLTNTQFNVQPLTTRVTQGPHRSPLGLSADAGGLPLYKNGEPVGAIGVESDQIYGLDLTVTDYDFDLDEVIARAGQTGYEPPGDILANRIFVVGKSLRYTDIDSGDLRTNPSAAPPLGAVSGALVTLNGYFDAAVGIQPGTNYPTVAAGIIRDPDGFYDFVGRPVFVLVDNTGANRFPPILSPVASGLTATEVATIIGNALKVAFAGRAQIRRPLPSFIQVTVSVVDTDGRILGIARTPDGPIFGIDTSLQKARTAAFFSNPIAAADLLATPANILGDSIAANVARVRALLGPTALANGIAFADRSGGNLSRPFFPDGIDGKGPGPFSKPFAVWSPFNTGLQLDLVVDNIAVHIIFTNTGAGDTAQVCTAVPNGAAAIPRVANGIQIFPGSVPIYRNGVLVGGVGVSGDGVDQDDMVSILGLHNAGIVLGTGVGNAPQGLRADNLAPGGAKLRFVNCPFKPFIGSNEQNVCHGK